MFTTIVSKEIEVTDAMKRDLHCISFPRRDELSTKEAYLLEALRLFADKGYEAVGVVEIAKAVGVLVLDTKSS